MLDEHCNHLFDVVWLNKRPPRKDLLIILSVVRTIQSMKYLFKLFYITNQNLKSPNYTYWLFIL